MLRAKPSVSNRSNKRATATKRLRIIYKPKNITIFLTFPVCLKVAQFNYNLISYLINKVEALLNWRAVVKKKKKDT